MEFSFIIIVFFFSLFLILLFNLLLFFLHLFLCLLFLLYFSPCSESLTYINLLYLPLFNLAYLFFLSFLFLLSSQHISFSFVALSPSWRLALVVLQFVLSFVLVVIIFGFLYLLGQSIVLYFCWTVLILLMGVYVYVYIQSHILFLL